MVEKLYSRLKFVTEGLRKKVKSVVITQTNTIATQRREPMPPPMPTKQLPPRNRGSYKEKNWDEFISRGR